LARTLKKQGFEVIVIAPNDSYAALLIKESFTFESIDMRQHKADVLSELNVVRQLYRIYKQYKPAVIFHYTIKPNIYGSIAAWLLGIPSIAVATGLGQFLSKRSWLGQILLDTIYRIGCACSRAVWFLNEEDKSTFIRKQIVGAHKTLVLPSEGINIQDFAPQDTRRHNHPPVFLFAGRLLREKGILLFVEAAKIIKANHPDVRFQVLGFIDPENPDSVSHTEVKRWISSGWIEYLGESDDVTGYIATCSCLVLPSSYHEGVPRTLLEAASMAKPIITSDAVGCRAVVTHGVNGFLCIPGNLDDLVRTIAAFLQLPPHVQQHLGQNGREKVIHTFDEQIVIQYYLDTLDKILIQQNDAK
jgi:glycosyltransferase involved in cell wall biosynthesis